MKICVFEPWYNEQHKSVLRAFAAGCGGVVCDVRKYVPCDVAVIFGMVKAVYRPTQYKADIIAAHKGKLIVIERGFVKRDEYWSAGFNNIAGKADFRNQDCPPDRWQKLDVKLQPYKSGGDYALVCGQVPWDVTCQDSNHENWCAGMVNALVKRGHAVRFRPHPLVIRKKIDYGIAPDVPISTRDIEKDFARASLCATYNSTSGVEAAIAGVPLSVSGPGSMAKPVESFNLATDKFAPVDRIQWTNNLAYSQWTLAEFQAGAAWDHLAR